MTRAGGVLGCVDQPKDSTSGGGGHGGTDEDLRKKAPRAVVIPINLGVVCIRVFWQTYRLSWLPAIGRHDSHPSDSLRRSFPTVVLYFLHEALRNFIRDSMVGASHHVRS
jgi:hypothetical protein